MSKGNRLMHETQVGVFFRKHMATLVICGIYWVIYFVGICIGDTVLYGALSGSGFQKLNGQYYRLITASFLHGGWLHIIANSLALFCVGDYLETRMGALRFLALYFGIDLLASVLFYLYFSECSNGAGSSIVLYGLFAVLLVLWLRFPTRFPTQRCSLQAVYLVGYFFAANLLGGNYTTIIIHAFSFTVGLAIGLTAVELQGLKQRRQYDAAQV